LPNKEFTTDSEIREISVKENRIVITKDSDFLDSFFVKAIPLNYFLYQREISKIKLILCLKILLMFYNSDS